ncbi:MAG: hypothetical protein Q9178_002963 [Gyalolechia marmorata]
MARKPKGGAVVESTATSRTPATDQGAPSSPSGNEDTNMGSVGKSPMSLPLFARSSVDPVTARTDNSSETFDEDSDAGLELLSEGMKAFVTVIQNLRDLGVEELVLPLPKIVVLGDQSTGKSSLIEGISGIKVPRSSGTCTRCPLEINLTPSEPGTPWRATIYLQKRYLYEGKPIAGSRREGATKNRPLGPWVSQSLPENSLFFKTNNKSDIPEALHLAQLATLNPGSDPSRYLPSATGAKNSTSKHIQVMFSPNVVRLDVSSPDVPNLSFYDLPGVINQAETVEEEYLVSLVQNLVRSYIKEEACINLLAMPMTDDAANSTASRLVQELSAHHRSVGVLTKPDRVQSGEGMAQWIDILDGKKFKIGHGYFVVKNNPNPDVSNVVARQEEDEFFNQKPWVGTLSAHGDRFGTLKLSAKLSKLLNLQIRTSLPKITNQVRLKRAEIVERLRQLPEPPKGNLSLKIFEKILAFEQDLRCHLGGGSEEYPFQKEFHTAAVRFRSTIAISYPRLNLGVFKSSAQLPYRMSVTPTPSSSGKRRSDVIPIDSDEEYDTIQNSAHTPSPSKRKQPSSTVPQSTPSKRSRLDKIPQFVPGQDGVNSLDISSTSVDRTAPFAKRFNLQEIRTILQDAHIGLPNQIDPKATKRMIKESLSHWHEPLDELLRFTSQACLGMILERASWIFGLWRGTRCFDILLETCESFFKKQLNTQTASAKRVLYIERQAALTLQEETMRSASEKELITLEAACRYERVKAFLSKQNPDWDDNLSDRAKADKMSKVTDAHLGPNPYVQELRAISRRQDVRGYYECAYSRFVDVIYQGMQANLFTACHDELGNALKQGIGLEEPDGRSSCSENEYKLPLTTILAEQRCAVLLAVDPENERVRAELVKQNENLVKASEWLESQ